MKRAFTLVEMLIVVALIATLMTIVLRLSSAGADESRRNRTIILLSKLENCLSGYYAAYGSYPPVPLHNSRDIYEGVNEYGVQNLDNTPGQDLSDSQLWNWDVKKFQQDAKNASEQPYEYSSQEAEKLAWRQIKGACISQPVALETPDPEIDHLSEGFVELYKYLQPRVSSRADADLWGNGFGTIYENLAGVGHDLSWRKVQVFKFGLMSFLLPRFQAMMGWPKVDMFVGDGSCFFEQWNASNGSAPHDPLEGNQSTWKEINALAKQLNRYGSETSADGQRKARAYLEALPSEAVAARWMPNLAGACCCDYPNRQFFGVEINDDRFASGLFTTDLSQLPTLCIYCPDGRNCYHLNRMTVVDGWKTDFFYYSPSPHQSYQLWSAGKNQRTFPPWISREKLSDKAKERVTAWTQDDIRGMSN